MVVFGHLAGIAVAERKNGGVVDGELQRLADALVGIGLLLDIGAGHDGVGGQHLRLLQAEPVEDRHIVGGGLVVGVDLHRLEGRDHRRGIGAVVDELDAVEIDLAAPPVAAILAALEFGPVADLVIDQLERTGADRVADEIAPVSSKERCTMSAG
jgi:hypothetical protein